MSAVTPRDPLRDPTHPVTRCHATPISWVTQAVTGGHAALRSRTPLKKGVRVTLAETVTAIFGVALARHPTLTWKLKTPIPRRSKPKQTTDLGTDVDS